MHHSIHDRPKNSWRRLACQAAAASVYVAVGLSIFAGSHAEAADARAEAAPAAPVPGMSGELRPVRIGYLREAVERPAPASRLDMEPRDAGIAGARQGLGENNAGGQFMGHLYSLGVANGISSEKAVAALEKLYQSGHNYIIADASAETLLKLSDYARGKDIMLFNVRATDVSLRQEDCRSNVMHIVPDRYMLADALAQYLVKMDWKNWLLVHGSMPDDLAYLEAVQRAAGRFGANVVDVREYQDISGGRRDDVGTIPPSTSGKDEADYDVIVVADEAQLFGPQIPYRGGAKPRVVAGTTGLVATTWSRGHEKWGATQANNNFEKDNRRLMLPIDYQAYVATRAIGEAVTRNANADFKTVAKFIHSDKLQLAPFKGIKQQFRPWDGQFRQPILIATEKVPVSVSPQRGFPHASHPEIEVDTLGIDEPESKCRMETTAAAAPG